MLSGRSTGEPSVRARLVVLVLSVVAPAALVLVLGSLQTWETGRTATERALVARVQTVAAAVARELDLARVALQVLATSSYLSSGDLESFHRQIAKVPRPEGAHIILTDGSGQILLSSRLPFGTPLSQHSNFGVTSRVFQTNQPQVSDLYMGQRLREPLLSVDVPVGNAGRLTHVLSMSMKAEVISRVLLRQQLPDAWTTSVIDQAGILVARSRSAAQFVGHPAAPAALAAIAAGENPFHSVAREGLPVRGASAPVGSYGWNAVAVVTQAELDAPLRSSLLLASVGSGLLLLLGLLTATWHANRIGRSVMALVGGAVALGRSETPPSVPPGVREASLAGVALRRAARRLERKRQERNLAERRRALVVAELNHRVKNMLATVQAIAAQTQRGTAGDPERFTAAFGARLRALARAHDLLTSNAWEDTDLRTVVEVALAPWLSAAPHSHAAAFSIRYRPGAPVSLRPHQAQSLVLALHELATNAAKYGALTRSAGRVEVWCGPDADGMAGLDWIEHGGPPIEQRPERRGFGMRLLERGLANDLGPSATVELSFAAEGLRASMRFPIRKAVSEALSTP
jgi:two-component sensor histidine kinase